MSCNDSLSDTWITLDGSADFCRTLPDTVFADDICQIPSSTGSNLDGSMVKSTCCFCRGSEFGSPHLHCDSQLPVTLTPAYLMPSSGRHLHCTLTHTKSHTDTHQHTNRTFKQTNKTPPSTYCIIPCLSVLNDQIEHKTSEGNSLSHFWSDYFKTCDSELNELKCTLQRATT